MIQRGRVEEGEGVLKEFTGPHSSSIRIQAIPEAEPHCRAHNLDALGYWLSITQSWSRWRAAALCFFNFEFYPKTIKFCFCDCLPWVQRTQCSGMGRARRMAQSQPPEGS